MLDLEHLSYSSISLYLDCGESWRRKYVEKQPTIVSPALIFGSAFHDTVEAAVGDPSADLLKTWTVKWNKRVGEADVAWGADTPEFHHNEGLRILSDQYVQEAIRAIKVGRDDMGIKVERKVELRVPGVPIPIIGFIDLITVDNIPCDLKTSARSWSEAKAADQLQSLFYLAALNQAGDDSHGWRFVHCVFVKTKEPKVQFFQHTHGPGEIFFLFKLIQSVWKGIERDVFPINPTGWKCDPKYCDFWADCKGKY